jgi:hypothetical protein
MKKLLIVLLMLCSNAYASILDLKLSTAQIFDVQWYISGSTLNASGFNYIYASVNYATQTTSAARWTSAQTADANSNGRYIGFFDSTTNPGTYGMAVFNSDGTKYKIINNTGSFRALADGAIFYNGNGMWGTLITTGQGYSYGQSGSWTVTAGYPTNTQLQAYVPPSSEPLAAGQTAAPAQPAAPGLCCGGSSTAFNADATNIARVQSFTLRTTADSQVYIDQVGNSNTVKVVQSGTRNNYVDYTGNGLSNIVNITQSGTAATTVNYTDLSVVGNSNTVNITQQSTGGSKGAFVTVNNNSNTVTLQQKDNGSHYADISVGGSNKTVDVLQQGSASHMAKINLSGNPTSLSLSQTGSTQQFYSITHTCATAGGCTAIQVQQGQ